MNLSIKFVKNYLANFFHGLTEKALPFISRYLPNTWQSLKVTIVFSSRWALMPDPWRPARFSLGFVTIKHLPSWFPIFIKRCKGMLFRCKYYKMFSIAEVLQLIWKTNMKLRKTLRNHYNNILRLLIQIPKVLKGCVRYIFAK